VSADGSTPAITRAVVGQYLRVALIWLIPALLLLPFYLLLIGISVLAGEGALLELALKTKGGIHSAVGLLLVLGALAILVFLIQEASVANDWVQGGAMVLVTGGVGMYFVIRELRKLAARR